MYETWDEIKFLFCILKSFSEFLQSPETYNKISIHVWNGYG
jgi:hypothetical protein